MTATKRYPARFYCGHCGQSDFTAKDAKPGGGKFGVCPSCKFGWLEKMHWNGFLWT